MISVLDEHFSDSLGQLSLLDIGCSTGILANHLSKRFEKVTGIDIDTKAIRFAKENYEKDNLHFSLEDSMNLSFSENSFDVVICAQIYEHVPDAEKLLKEIYRVLKPEGVCYFAAANRLNVMEAHYKLPFLSIIPKPLGHFYLRLLRRGNHYYETHRTLWGLRKLISQFKPIDYTARIINDPEKFHATEMMEAGSAKQKLAQIVLKFAYFLFPTYIWLLQKNKCL